MYSSIPSSTSRSIRFKKTNARHDEGWMAIKMWCARVVKESLAGSLGDMCLNV